MAISYSAQRTTGVHGAPTTTTTLLLPIQLLLLHTPSTITTTTIATKCPSASRDMFIAMVAYIDKGMSMSISMSISISISTSASRDMFMNQTFHRIQAASARSSDKN